METPLTPLEFARRARKLYPEQIAVIDGESRWSYAEFLDRCDRWSAVLQRLGVGAGDRVAYLAPNTHAQLESFYSVPQLGRSEEHTSELQSQSNLVCRLLLEKKKTKTKIYK